ncbi:MAG: tRNA (adenosine(37)-N6)-dimethylallyltransferase MiaA [Anaerolineae bacterium]|nr:tRNA (adenosine(37)-N6)-dimethylallyltransferase MiaA [Anaerolineae bacterium]
MTGKPLIVITGPTSVGKTGYSVKIAQAIGGEILGADSRQIYRYMDIGTAKPTDSERAMIKHHLIDLVLPDENLSLAQYQRAATEVIADLHQRGQIPILVGGTAQYLTAISEGWTIPEVPPNEQIRAELEQFAAEHGSQALFARLHAVDPQAAAKIEHHQNVRRVVRALEVYLETGTPISDLQRRVPPDYTILTYVLTMARERLYQRADHRVDQMIEAGFLGEVRRLLTMGYDRSLPSMSGLGYAQLAAHLLDGIGLDQAIQETKLATHAYIRRQYTWFRKYNQNHQWRDVEQSTPDDLIAEIRQWL